MPRVLSHALSFVAAGLLALAAPAAAADASGEARLRWDLRDLALQGPLAEAERTAPGLVPPQRDAATAELEARGSWRAPVGPLRPLSLSANLLLATERAEGGATRDELRFNELHVSADLGAWQVSAGRKIVGWDVGFGFRPNDVVQQEERRTLLDVTPEGRPLLQLERFGAESAVSLVWVNPQAWNDAADAQRFGAERALAVRAYRRAGAADWHGFARHGRHTGASLGAALAWVAGDELELHASLRVLERHDGWAIDPAAGDAPVPASPWSVQTRGGASQWLVGASWTGALRQSLLVEFWHDGTALPDDEWDRWQQRNGALATLAAAPGPGLPAAALAGNLAWQAAPFAAASLRQDVFFVRAAWQPDAWQSSLDLLLTPSDRGRAVTASLQWQGDRVRIKAALRRFGGPTGAVLAQLPQRRQGVLAAIWSW